MHLASVASDNQLSSSSPSPSPPQAQKHRQHRRQPTGQTTQTNSSNGSRDDVSSFGTASGSGSGSGSGSPGWFSTPAGTSDDILMIKDHKGSSTGSRGTLAVSSESDEAGDMARHDAEVPVRRVMSPIRNSTIASAQQRSPLDKLQASLKQTVSRNSQNMAHPAAL